MMTDAPAVCRPRGLIKRYGQVVALDGADFELMTGEILAVIGDNGAGKSSLIKALTGALHPGRGRDPARRRAGPVSATARRAPPASRPSTRTSPSPPRSTSRATCSSAARSAGPASLGTVLRHARQEAHAGGGGRAHGTISRSASRSIDQPVETLSGGQRQAVAVPARSPGPGTSSILDEPTAALGVKESGQVLDLIRRVRDRGLPVVLISHNMPHVFEIADRIHIQRLGRRVRRSAAGPQHGRRGDHDRAPEATGQDGGRRSGPQVWPGGLAEELDESVDALASTRRPTLSAMSRSVSGAAAPGRRGRRRRTGWSPGARRGCCRRGTGLLLTHGPQHAGGRGLDDRPGCPRHGVASLMLSPAASRRSYANGV